MPRVGWKLGTCDHCKGGATLATLIPVRRSLSKTLICPLCYGARQHPEAATLPAPGEPAEAAQLLPRVEEVRREPGASPIFRQDDAGEVWADSPFPDVIEVSTALLDNALDRYVERRGNVLEFHLANGRWVYEIVEERPDRESVIGEIRSREER